MFYVYTFLYVQKPGRGLKWIQKREEKRKQKKKMKLVVLVGYVAPRNVL